MPGTLIKASDTDFGREIRYTGLQPRYRSPVARRHLLKCAKINVLLPITFPFAHSVDQSQSEDDDEQYPKANAPIMPDEPAQQAPVAEPEAPVPEQRPQAEQSEIQAEVQPQPETIPQAQQPAEQETRPLPVYREVPLPQNPHIAPPPVKSGGFLPQGIRGIRNFNPFEALSALSSAPSEALSSLASISMPLLARPGINIEQLINSALQSEFPTNFVPAPSYVQSTYAPQGLRPIRGPPRGPARGRVAAPYGHPPPVYQHQNLIVKNHARMPLRSTYASGWIPKDLPHDWQPGPIRSADYQSDIFLKFTVDDRITSRPGQYQPAVTSPTTAVTQPPTSPSTSTTTTTTTTTVRPPPVRPTSPAPATKPIKQIIRIFLHTQPPTVPDVAVEQVSAATPALVTRKLKVPPPTSTTTVSTTSSSTSTTTSTTERPPVTIELKTSDLTREESVVITNPNIELKRTSPRKVEPEVSEVTVPQPRSNTPPPTESSIEIFTDIPRLDKKVGLVRDPIWV